MGIQTERPIEVRAAEPSDRRSVLELLGPTLGWSGDNRFDALYSWKHEQNPFGESPSWVAVVDGMVVGFRTFLRWELRGPDGEVFQGVRAVDTATRRSHQGRGIFRQLTLRAVDDLQTEGVAFVFNTPNDNSRPGYLKMGWVQVGRLPAAVRVTSPASLGRMRHARVPADLWSIPTEAARPAAEVLARPGLVELLGALPAPSGLSTHRTPEYLRWRYGYAPLAYRAITLGDDLDGGVAVFRLRRRGRALECVLCELLTPAGDPHARRTLSRSVVRESSADYVLRLGGPVIDRQGFVHAPGQGPILTWRPLRADAPRARIGDWALALGDVELF
jgi:hypothetical protein